MSESDFKTLDEKITYGLQVAEREMLEEKARRRMSSCVTTTA